MRHLIVRQRSQMIDQIERRAIRGGQVKAVPLQPHDQIGLSTAVLEKPMPRFGAAVAAVGDTHLARDRRAVGQGLGAFAVGQFQVREAAGPEVVDTMHAPIGAFAAGFGDAGAISDAYRTSGQCSAWLADLAASRWSVMALRKSTELSRRYFTAGLVRVSKPSMPAQPAASRNDMPPGPCAKARRSSSAPV